MITKQKAIEIHDTIETNDAVALRGLLESLDAAGAFPDEATLAEIARAAGAVFSAERSWRDRASWRDYALRLATACRKAGLVK